MIKIGFVECPGGGHREHIEQVMAGAGMTPIYFSCQDISPALFSSCRGFIVGNAALSREHLSTSIIDESMARLLRHEAQLGKPILGAGSGAVVLTAIGLVPGLSAYQAGLQVIEQPHSVSAQLHAERMQLVPDYQLNAFTLKLNSEQFFRVPVAALQWQFLIPPGLFLEMASQGLFIFQYGDAKGRAENLLTVDSLNLSREVAALSNRMGNIMAMIPTLDADDALTEALLGSMAEYIRQGHVEKVRPLNYQPR